MGSAPFGNPFDKANFPDHKDPNNESTGVAELYPKRLNDEINDVYHHNKVLPRVEGKDYLATKTSTDQEDAQINGQPTFPYDYGK